MGYPARVLPRQNRRPRSGYSLLELLIALCLVAVLLGLATPPLTRALGYARARSARDVVAAQLARTRVMAVARGGADLVLDLPAARSWIECGDTVTVPVVVGDERRIRLSANAAAADTVRIGYDAIGLGHMASRTLRFRAGEAEAGLTVSSYGRVRRW